MDDLEIVGTMLMQVGIFISVVIIISIFITWTIPSMTIIRILMVCFAAIVTGYIIKGKL